MKNLMSRNKSNFKRDGKGNQFGMLIDRVAKKCFGGTNTLNEEEFKQVSLNKSQSFFNKSSSIRSATNSNNSKSVPKYNKMTERYTFFELETGLYKEDKDGLDLDELMKT